MASVRIVLTTTKNPPRPLFRQKGRRQLARKPTPLISRRTESKDRRRKRINPGAPPLTRSRPSRSIPLALALEGQRSAHALRPSADTPAGVEHAFAPHFDRCVVTLVGLRIGDDIRRRPRLGISDRLKVGIRREGLHRCNPLGAAAHNREHWQQESCGRQEPQR